jgi:PAS domain S-box-containing protein
MGTTAITAYQFNISTTNIVRVCVIASLAVSCTLITALAFSRSLDLISYQIFYIPIIYAAYTYPRKGVIISGICGVAFEAVGFYYNYPDLAALTAVTLEAILFIIVSCVFSYLIQRIHSSEIGYRTLFEHSQLGILLFNRQGFSIGKMNEKFLEMLHYKQSDLAGRDFSGIFFTPREKERFLERIEKQPNTADFETRLKTSEGDGCWVNLSWSMVDEHTISVTAVDINARKFAEKANNDNMMKYRQLTEHSPTGILIVDQGCIRYANPAFIGFLGFTLNELIGKEIDLFVLDQDHNEFTGFKKLWTSIPIKPAKGEFRLVTKTGTNQLSALFSVPIVHFGKPATLINVVDNSEKERLTDRIQADNERRRGIIVTVAHELRTPLQPILGYLNLLVQDPEGYGIRDDTKRILERCLVSVDRERQIISQMLELSVLESGRLTLNYSTFSLITLVKSVVDARGYTTEAEIAFEIPENQMISADMDRLYVVFDSILSNAINYSKAPRKITIAYDFASSDCEHRISVQDNGIGIAGEALPSIFEPFQLADAAKLSRRYDRIGLSLSIAKKIVEMHGGNITVESSVNVGSTFTLHLPKEVRNGS